ncbi:hypothetical protein SARC_00922 [Sphaeroforma arctica JP610]|uniref:VOC domain-containing protein n=1 Tax=Sphaeroforma arctica JP610 TaxID=667725 RepID=A0A0L0GD81_9EUKA|nr:hypothetical protein SARC_00922 [Sphaeroforma arctica JP610]KNC86972.1 hypothetical protein SARC_00922 [Sphaeroforma arctica JP610]|eukprot:XP_014160874.1 hypothetical protein SARC_00922 [Sphaeroforma arctica JP610]
MERGWGVKDTLLCSLGLLLHIFYITVSLYRISFFQINMSSLKAAQAVQSIAPFHHAFPVHSVAATREFYGNVLGCIEGRSHGEKWVDFSLFGHQIVCHHVGDNHRSAEYFSDVDVDEVPVPHFGVVLDEPDFHAFADRCKSKGVKFVIEPHRRFQGQPGEQWTMFFKDPSNNSLEFKAMINKENLFAKYDQDGYSTHISQ